MTDERDRDHAERFATTLRASAAWPVVAIAGIAFAAPFCPSLSGGPAPSLIARMAFLAAIAAGLATLVLSTVVLFDALLFRLIASHVSEATGTAAVDDLLMRMRLKSASARNRPLAERIAGTRRVLLKQRLALAVFIIAAFVACR